MFTKQQSNTTNPSTQLKRNQAKEAKQTRDARESRESKPGQNINVNLSQFSDEVIQTFSLMNQTIQNLDQKIDKVLRNHQAQFLFAWRNHIKKIKIQLQQIKDRSDQKQRTLNSNQKLVSMEKQMTIFRDQSLKLYEELQQKKIQHEICKKKLREQKQNNFVLQQQNKQLIKVVKMSQAKCSIYLQQIAQLQEIKREKVNMSKIKTKTDSFNENESTKLKNFNSNYNSKAHTKTLYLQSISKTRTIPIQNNKTVNVMGANQVQKQRQRQIIYRQVNQSQKQRQKQRQRQRQMQEQEQMQGQCQNSKIQTQNGRLSLAKHKEFTLQQIKNTTMNKQGKIKYKKANRFYNQKWQTSQINIQNKNFEFQQNGDSNSIIPIVYNHNHTSTSVPRKRFSLQRQMTSKVTFSPQIYDSQIKNWFVFCIQSVKKQISTRKTQRFSTSTYAVLRSNSLQQFKTIDKLRLLQMFLENQKLLVHMYQKIFPDRINEIQAYLNMKATQNGLSINQNNFHKGDLEGKAAKMQTSEIIDDEMLNILEKNYQQKQKQRQSQQNLNSNINKNTNININVKISQKNRQKSKSLRHNVGNVALLKDGKLRLG